jgi:hypothetical protein
MACLAVPARRKERVHKIWKGPECNNEIENRSSRRLLRLGNERLFKETVRQILVLVVVKRVVGISIGLGK